MSEAKFTKGPWKVWGDWAIKDCTPDENLIATYEHGEFANANLIAAAPEMYEMLEAIATLRIVPTERKLSELLAKVRGEI